MSKDSIPPRTPARGRPCHKVGLARALLKSLLGSPASAANGAIAAPSLWSNAAFQS
jgi:hypothetical protein